jgi:hypothetical protein
MQSSPQSPDQPQCPICRAEISPGLHLCQACGSKLIETPAEEIRSLNYLLAELSRWEAKGIVRAEQATELRESYERRREELRAQLGPNGRQLKQPLTPPVAQLQADAAPGAPKPSKPGRTFLETLANPHTIRLLLYTGAAMLVVGVVIWLRDVLYLKLQEPIVQAGLLIVGTVLVTVSGWLTILRTRLLLTGRALTLTGSLLVPVNFWFLVRSGLIHENGRAWLVCAFCTLLYAHTAALLREKLYVYLAGLAAIATAWTLIYRFESEAFGPYALTLMTLSLLFLHLSRLFPAETDDKRPMTASPQSAIRNLQLLWGAPLVHLALVSAALSLLFYMPLRLGSSPDLADGLFRPRAMEYDAGTAMLLFTMAAYAAWFAGRHIYTKHRTIFYTASVLALFWTEFLAADALNLSGPVQLLILAATALVVALSARALKDEARAAALQRASLLVCVALVFVIYPVISAEAAPALTHSLILVFLAAAYAASDRGKAADEQSAHASIVFACATLLVAQAMIHLRVGEPQLLAPSVLLGLLASASFGASLRPQRRLRVHLFRTGLYTAVLAFVLAALRAGFDPLGDVEVYSVTVAHLLLVVAYLSMRLGWAEYAADTSLLLWAGSILLAGPLLTRALEHRLVLGVPATGRDLMILGASLALILFGVLGRLRAPAIIGAIALALELLALALTSVDWLQIPLKVYLISTGASVLIVWGLLEFRREQILKMRQRLNERRETAREQFGGWR